MKAEPSDPVAGAENPKNWRENSNEGKMDITFDEPEQALRFDVDFPQSVKDRWVYPFFDCPKGLTGSALAFDIKVDLAGSGGKTYLAMFNDGKKSHYLPYTPENHQWTKIIVEFGSIDPQKLKSFQIGLHLRDQLHGTWYLRNVRVLK